MKLNKKPSIGCRALAPLLACVIVVSAVAAPGAMQDTGAPSPAKGVVTLANGDRYEGELVDGQPHGVGVLLSAAGWRYEGEFVAGRRSGQGKLLQADGTLYQGTFVNGRRTGEGQQQWPNGDRYVGSFVDGLRVGRGSQTYADGNSYVGLWEANKRAGQGQMSFANGDRFTGRFEADVATGPGVYQWKSGSTYEGSFASNDLSGPGRLELASGLSYEGAFEKGRATGRGTVSAKGWRYEGVFQMGVPTEGRYSTADGAELPPPVPVEVRQALFVGMPPTDFWPSKVISAMICTGRGWPQPPNLPWQGELLFKATVLVEDGQVTGVTVDSLKRTGSRQVDEAFRQAISQTVRTTYRCPGWHVFEQEFRFQLR